MKKFMPWIYVVGLIVAIALSFFNLEALTVFVILAALGLTIGLLSLHADEVYFLTLLAFVLAFSFLMQSTAGLYDIKWLPVIFEGATTLTAVVILVVAFKFLFTTLSEVGMRTA